MWIAAVVMILALLFVAYGLYACVREYGEEEISFWAVLGAMMVAKVLSRGVGKLVTEAPTKLALGFGVYIVVLTVYLAVYAKVPLGRSVLMGVGAGVLMFGAAVGSLLFIGKWA